VRKTRPRLRDVFRGRDLGEPVLGSRKYPAVACGAHGKSYGLGQPRLTDIFGQLDDFPSSPCTDKFSTYEKEGAARDVELKYAREVLSRLLPASECTPHHLQLRDAPPWGSSSLAARRGLKLRPVLTPPRSARAKQAVQRVPALDRIWATSAVGYRDHWR